MKREKTVGGCAAGSGHSNFTGVPAAQGSAGTSGAGAGCRACVPAEDQAVTHPARVGPSRPAPALPGEWEGERAFEAVLEQRSLAMKVGVVSADGGPPPRTPLEMVRSTRAVRSFSALVGVAIPAWLRDHGQEGAAERLEVLAMSCSFEPDEVDELRKALRPLRELGLEELAEAAWRCADWLREAQELARRGLQLGATTLEAAQAFSIFHSVRGLSLLRLGEASDL